MGYSPWRDGSGRDGKASWHKRWITVRPTTYQAIELRDSRTP